MAAGTGSTGFCMVISFSSSLGSDPHELFGCQITNYANGPTRQVLAKPLQIEPSIVASEYFHSDRINARSIRHPPAWGVALAR